MRPVRREVRSPRIAPPFSRNRTTGHHGASDSTPSGSGEEVHEVPRPLRFVFFITRRKRIPCPARLDGQIPGHERGMARGTRPVPSLRRSEEGMGKGVCTAVHRTVRTAVWGKGRQNDRRPPAHQALNVVRPSLIVSRTWMVWIWLVGISKGFLSMMTRSPSFPTSMEPILSSILIS